MCVCFPSGSAPWGHMGLCPRRLKCGRYWCGPESPWPLGRSLGVWGGAFQNLGMVYSIHRNGDFGGSSPTKSAKWQKLFEMINHDQPLDLGVASLFSDKHFGSTLGSR